MTITATPVQEVQPPFRHPDKDDLLFLLESKILSYVDAMNS
jgi:hypothetical protein